MDVLSGFQHRGRAPLGEVAALLGLPGKLGMDGSQVWDAYLAGGITQIRNYCETDVLNTHLVYLHFQHFRGVLDEAGLERERGRVRELLAQSPHAHLHEFLAAWEGAAARG
jgi:predicted PolB exonuclease-like 3'-5' exonuclease